MVPVSQSRQLLLIETPRLRKNVRKQTTAILDMVSRQTRTLGPDEREVLTIAAKSCGPGLSVALKDPVRGFQALTALGIGLEPLEE